MGKHGVRQTLALTVPHQQYDLNYLKKHGDDEPIRKTLNGCLRAMCTAQPQALYLNLERPDHRSQLELDEDGLHFTPAGYDALGDIVADCLLWDRIETKCHRLSTTSH